MPVSHVPPEKHRLWLFLEVKVEDMERPAPAEIADKGNKAGRAEAVRNRGLRSCDSRAAYESEIHKENRSWTRI